jgi:hypothetical protein
MTDNSSTQTRLIRRVAKDPLRLEDISAGGLLSVEVALAMLSIADDAIRVKDVRTLDWLWDLAIHTFNEHQPPNDCGASFVDIYEYLSDLSEYVKDGIDPLRVPVLIAYRRTIAEELRTEKRRLSDKGV